MRIISSFLLTLTIATGNPAYAQFEERDLIWPSDAQPADAFGTSVAVSGDVLVGGTTNHDETGENSGAAYVYRFDGEHWIEEQKLLAVDGGESDWFGRSVGVSGNYVVVGAPLHHTDCADGQCRSGAVYLFYYNGTSWVEVQKLLTSDRAEGDNIGYAVAIEGDSIVIGAIAAEVAGVGAGAAYIFERTGAVWTERAKLIASDADFNDAFGCALGLSGDTAIIGAYNDDGASTNAGAAYIFRRSASIWHQESKLTAPDAAAHDRFGRAVDITDARVIIGAKDDDDHGTRSGSAYIFSFDGSGWHQEQKLLDAGGEAYDEFGTSVAIEGSFAFVGTPQLSEGWTLDYGVTFPFEFDGTSWVQAEALSDPVPGSEDTFGVAIAFDGSTLVVGQTGDDHAYAMNSGSIHVFYDSDGTTTIEDCNDNGIDDTDDIAFGTSQDCNDNGIPDECDIDSGSSTDLDSDGTPDECQADCNDDGIPDYYSVVTGLSPDCNGNLWPDDCDIAYGISEDLDGDGIPDECKDIPFCGDGERDPGEQCDGEELGGETCTSLGDYAGGTLSCTLSCIFDTSLCEIEPIVDCNENGIPDEQDIATGTSEDCDSNGIPDECQAGGSIGESSGPLSPIGYLQPQTFTISSTQQATTDVLLNFEAQGDFNAALEYVSIDINGLPLGSVFVDDAADCPATPDEASLIISMAIFNQALADSGAVTIGMTTSSGVNPAICSGSSNISLTVSYQSGKGLSCEPTCVGDIDKSGEVGFTDMLLVIGAWGTCSECAEDLDGSGDVGLTDLLTIFTEWGTC